MKRYPALAVERTMKVQEVILRAMSGSRLAGWIQTAETERPSRILGISQRSMLRWKQRYDKHGYDGLLDRRTQQPSPRAGADGKGRESAAALPGSVLRFQCAAFRS